MEYNLARDEQTRVLNPYQSAYLLLDNGREDPADCVQTFRRDLDKFMSDITTLGKGIYKSTNADLSMPAYSVKEGPPKGAPQAKQWKYFKQHFLVYVDSFGVLRHLMELTYYFLNRKWV